MNKLCKNCKYSILFRGQSGGKAYFCQLKTTDKVQIGRTLSTKQHIYLRVKENECCDKYEERGK